MVSQQPMLHRVATPQERLPAGGWRGCHGAKWRFSAQMRSTAAQKGKSATVQRPLPLRAPLGTRDRLLSHAACRVRQVMLHRAVQAARLRNEKR